MSKAVFGVVKSAAQAESLVTELKQAGFEYNDISVLFPAKAGTKHVAHEKHPKAPEAATAGGAAGGVAGGVLGWLAGIGVFTIPGLGPFVAAGPVLAALSGLGAGGAMGGIAGALIGMGIPEYEAKRYEGRIKGGKMLVSVHAAGKGDSAQTARELFENAGAEDISTASESTPIEEKRWEPGGDPLNE
jgi:hypothetical protein